jgi:ATP-binding cassette subfamily F protein 3
MLALVDFSFEFAGRYLYKNANWHIKPGEKIGLVGLNGTGKSTLLRLISGD